MEEDDTAAGQPKFSPATAAQESEGGENGNGHVADGQNNQERVSPSGVVLESHAGVATHSSVGAAPSQNPNDRRLSDEELEAEQQAVNAAKAQFAPVKGKMFILGLILSSIGILQMVGALACTVTIYYYRGANGCINPFDVALAQNFTRFQETKDMCQLGTVLLATVGFSPSAPFSIFGPLAAFSGFMRISMVVIFGTGVFVLGTLLMVGFLIALIATEWPAIFPIIFGIFMGLTAASAPLSLALIRPYKLHEAIARHEKAIFQELEWRRVEGQNVSAAQSHSVVGDSAIDV